MKLLLILFVLLSLVSCTKWPVEPVKKQEIIYMSSWQSRWKQEMLDKCQKEVAILSLAIYDSKVKTGHVQSKEEFQAMVKMLSDQCVRHYNLSV